MEKIIAEIRNSVLLIVDGDEIKDKLTLPFAKTYVATDAEEALTILSEHKIDITIIDIKEAQKELQTISKIAGVFKGILIVSVNNLKNSDTLDLNRMGIDDFIPRNFTSEELERVIILAYNKIMSKKLIKKMNDKLSTMEKMVDINGTN